jgi:hypothetical protein
MAWIFLFIVGFGLYYKDLGYFQETNRACIVLDKLESTHIGKYTATNEFILVLRLPDNTVTDLEVRPHVWSQTKEGDTLYFLLSDFELHRDGWKFFPHFFGICLMLISGIMTLSHIAVNSYRKFS